MPKKLQQQQRMSPKNKRHKPHYALISHHAKIKHGGVEPNDSRSIQTF
jgi:hypothetical protein